MAPGKKIYKLLQFERFLQFDKILFEALPIKAGQY
jgi:hypothetical protein